MIALNLPLFHLVDLFFPGKRLSLKLSNHSLYLALVPADRAHSILGENPLIALYLFLSCLDLLNDFLFTPLHSLLLKQRLSPHPYDVLNLPLLHGFLHLGLLLLVLESFNAIF